MPRGVQNWTYKAVVAVLLANGFTEQTSHHQSGTSHHFFVRQHEGKDYLVHVQLHARQSLPPKTMETIINTSGLPKKYWIKMASLNRRTIKKTPYVTTA